MNLRQAADPADANHFRLTILKTQYNRQGKRIPRKRAHRGRYEKQPLYISRVCVSG